MILVQNHDTVRGEGQFQFVQVIGCGAFLVSDADLRNHRDQAEAHRPQVFVDDLNVGVFMFQHLGSPSFS